MSQDYWQVQNNAKVHKGPVELDEAVISREISLSDAGVNIFLTSSPGLPRDAVVKGCEHYGKSAWNTTARIDLDVRGSQVSFFLKLREGPNAGSMFEGEYKSMKLINKIIPDFSPEPIARGKLRNSDGYFILFSFHHLSGGTPSIPDFPNAVAKLHNQSINAEFLRTLNIDPNPTGQFGFNVPTYNGTLEQKNTWTDTWEEFYADEMRHMLKLEEEARGPSEELQQLSGPFLDKVIPRLLRPLETGGRSIKPVLLHGDLWLGNVSTQTESEKPLILIEEMRKLVEKFSGDHIIEHQHIAQSTQADT
ncbi:hypothetical protein Neosp_014909 [[Neocosmospora] mangrovei]